MSFLSEAARGVGQVGFCADGLDRAATRSRFSAAAHAGAVILRWRHGIYACAESPLRAFALADMVEQAARAILARRLTLLTRGTVIQGAP